MSDTDPRSEVRKRALRLLARREHSVRELERKLAVRDFDLVSDARYAAAFVRDAVRLKPRSRSMLVKELDEKGVARPVAEEAIDAAFAEADVGDTRLARRAADRYVQRLAGASDEARWQRLAGHLQRRGFDNTLIYDLCRELLPGVDA